MRGLANLSKFNGYYEEWQKIIKQNGLKWKEADDSFDFFEKENISEMLDYVKQVIKVLPAEYGNTFVVATLLGLRADEVCKAIRLLKKGAKDYYNPQYGVLEHFKFKDLFIRRSKKAYISIADNGLIELAKQSSDDYVGIRLRLRRKEINTHMAYCRKIFATWLRQNGMESEFVDLLQGRTPSSMFARHYYRPNFKDEIGKVRVLLVKLHSELQ